jgi:hypothetical protein
METEGSLPHWQVPATCLSWVSSIQTIPPHPTSWRSILILSSHLRLGLPSGLFPSGFPTKTLLDSPLSHPSYMPRPTHSSRFYHPHDSGWGVQIMKLLIMKFSPLTCYPVPLRRKYCPQHAILKPWAYVPFSMSVAKFHTHTKQK